MHFNVDYGQMPPTRAFRKALLDCREYVGRKKFPEFRRILREQPVTCSVGQLQMGLLLVGISGYPVRALHKAYIESRQ